MLSVGYILDVYSLKFKLKLGYWPVFQLTFIDVWSERHGDTRLSRRQNLNVNVNVDVDLNVNVNANVNVNVHVNVSVNVKF